MTVELQVIEAVSQSLERLHPFHDLARRELSEWVGSWLSSDTQVHHLLLQGPAGCGKHHLAQALKSCLTGRIDVVVAPNEGSPGFESGIAVWIARDGAVPKTMPARTPRIRMRSLGVSEKRTLLGSLIDEASAKLGGEADKLRQPEILQVLLDGGDPEASLRGAVRRLEKLCRNLALEIGAGRSPTVELAWAKSVLGPEGEIADPLPSKLPAGCVHAPVVSSLGGAMARIEAFSCPGQGRTVATGAGPLADQSVRVARTRCAMLAPHLGLAQETLRDLDWHVNVVGPEGPKDGVSLGWPVLVAMVSHLKRTTIDAQVAFSGEITLSGEIRSVGGIEEKFLACERNAIGRFWVPQGNMAELSALGGVVDCIALTAESDEAALREWGLLVPREVG